MPYMGDTCRNETADFNATGLSAAAFKCQYALGILILALREDAGIST